MPFDDNIEVITDPFHQNCMDGPCDNSFALDRPEYFILAIQEIRMLKIVKVFEHFTIFKNI